MRATTLRRERWDPLAIDGHTADRLLRGLLEPADAPPRYRHVASAIQQLRKHVTPDERAGGPAALASIVAELGSSDTDEAPDARPSIRRGSGRLKIMALGCLASLSLTTGLGIAGALPDGPQALVASVLNGVGVGAPTPGSSRPARPNPRSGSSPVRSVDPALGAPISQDPTTTTSTPAPTAPAAGPEAGAPGGGPGGGSGGGAPTSGGPGGGSGNAGGNGHGNAGSNAGGNGNGNAGGNGHGNAGGSGNAGGNGNGNAGGNGNGHGR